MLASVARPSSGGQHQQGLLAEVQGLPCGGCCHERTSGSLVPEGARP